MRMKPKALAEWKEELSKEAVMQDSCPTWDEETPLPWMIGVHAGGLNSLCGKTRICMKGASIRFSFRSLGTTYPWPIGSTKRQSYAHIRIKVGSPTVLSPMGAADGNSNISFRTTKVHIFIDKFLFRWLDWVTVAIPYSGCSSNINSRGGPVSSRVYSRICSNAHHTLHVSLSIGRYEAFIWLIECHTIMQPTNTSIFTHLRILVGFDLYPRC